MPITSAASDELSKAFDPERLLVAGRPDGELKRAARSARREDRPGPARGHVPLGRRRRQGPQPRRSLRRRQRRTASCCCSKSPAGACCSPATSPVPTRTSSAGICARGPPLYLLKVAHHGSGLSTDSGFLADTDPRFAVISVGLNSYWASRAARPSRGCAARGHADLHDAEERHDHPDDQALRIRQVAVHEDVTAADDGFYCTLNVSHAVVAAVCVAVCAMEARMR